jgi:O-antigen/teichoic acid export membrane protein
MLSSALEMIFISGNSALAPHIANALNDADKISSRRSLRNLTVTLGFLILLISAIAAGAFTLLGPYIFGREYAGVEKYAVIISASSALTGIYYLFVNYLFLFEKTGTVSLITITSAGIKLILLWHMISISGAMGAAVATLITNLIMAVSIVFYSGKVYPLLRIETNPRN